MGVVIWILLAASAVAIAVGSLVSGAPTWPPGVSPGVSHLLAYTLLGALVTLALGTSVRGLLTAFLLTALAGMGLEALQLKIPARTFSFFYLAMNMVGTVVGVGGVALLRWVRLVRERERRV